MTRRRLLYFCVAALHSMTTTLNAQTRPGQYSYGSEQNCVASGKFNAQQCVNAAANSQAEFEEKAPRFPSRDACEKVFAAAGCSVGFKGSEGWEGKKSGIYFSPRQQGFRLGATQGRDMAVTPFTSGPEIRFSPRSIAKRETAINPSAGRSARDSWRARPVAGGGGETFGVNTPPKGGDHAAIPPPRVDPNFDCASVLEPSVNGQAEIGCYPAPARRR